MSKLGEMPRAQPDHEQGREDKPQLGEVAGQRLAAVIGKRGHDEDS
jgi:hypothetical protein